MNENSRFIEGAYGLVKSKSFQAIYGLAMAVYLCFAFYNVYLGIQQKRATEDGDDLNLFS